jgi:NAD(P)-dependent dehydrogenase (short-subunit alcohol dehydrogenase family)
MAGAGPGVVTGSPTFCRRQDMDKVLLVTGASRGIGAATARLAAQGTAGRWRSTTPPTRWPPTRWCASSAPVVAPAISGAGRRGRRGAGAAHVRAVDAKLGRLTGLVNNAGVVDVPARLDEMSLARWRRMFDINVIGSLLCAREAVRRMSTATAAPAAPSSTCPARRLAAGRAGRIRGLCRRQGRHRQLHHRPGQGSRRPRASASTPCARA